MPCKEKATQSLLRVAKQLNHYERKTGSVGPGPGILVNRAGIWFHNSREMGYTKCTKTMKKCAYCGRENDDASIVCFECGVELPGPPKRESDRDLSDPALSLVTIATFSSLQEASLLVDRLGSAGIEACIPEEYAPQVFSGVIPLERLTVRVAAKDYEAAKAMIAEDDSREPVSSDVPQDQKVLSGDKPEARTRQPSESKPCVACGEAIPSDSKTCPACGWTQPA